MSRRIDLTGQKFNRLTVLEFSHIDENKLAHWKCLCICGKQIIADGHSLRRGNTQSCGCYKKDRLTETLYKDISNERFGNLLVIRDVGRTKAGKVRWECLCDCGNKSIVVASDLRSGKTVSCGCNRDWNGKNNPKWRDGSCKSKYSALWTKKLRAFIRNLDQHKCRFPDCNYDDTKENKKLDVHHIDGNKQNCETYNLISLCGKHHSFIESNNPKKYIDFFHSVTGKNV